MTTCDYFQWYSPSISKMYYSVCDILTQHEPNNWLRSGFIDLKDAQLLGIEIGYRLVNCRQPVVPGQYCKTYLGFYAYHSDRKLFPAPDPTQGGYKFIDYITTTTALPELARRKAFLYRGKMATKARGVYLGFLDRGACIMIQNVTIDYKFCPERGGELVKFPRTAAPANDLFPDEKAGECSDKNSVSDTKLTGVCLSSGKWNITNGLKCRCKKGYQIVEMVPNSLECKGVYFYYFYNIEGKITEC